MNFEIKIRFKSFPTYHALIRFLQDAQNERLHKDEDYDLPQKGKEGGQQKGEKNNNQDTAIPAVARENKVEEENKVAIDML